MISRELSHHSRKVLRRNNRRTAAPILPFFLLFIILSLIFYGIAQLPLPEGSPSSRSQSSLTDTNLLKAASQPSVPSASPVASQISQSSQAAQPKSLSAGEDVPWNLVLVNPWNPVPEDLSVTLTHLKNNQAVDERCYPDLQKMMDGCRAAGLSPRICSSYRTMEKQQRLYQNQIQAMLNFGLSQEQAEAEAGKAVAVPGTSEHQLGLAVDIVDEQNQTLDESQEETAVQQWLMAHCWEYGFILRYPTEKSHITGIMYEPWHYRYVGREAAAEIYEKDVCLEEYLGKAG